MRLLKAVSMSAAGVISEVVTNRLYKLLEDQDPSVQIESLQALLALGDDYAPKVLRDYVQEGNEQAVAQVLSPLTKTISHETFEVVLDAIRLESVPVQDSLRKLLPLLSEGGFAEEIRTSMVSALKDVPGGPVQSQSAAATLVPTAPMETSLNQGKVEFKFKREHMKEMTVFFIDIAGYTEKSTTVDNSTLITIIRAFEEIVTTTVTGYFGAVVKKMGDGILAVFGSPVNAVKAALEVQRKIHEYSSMRVEQEKFQARIGLNTGKVIRRENDIFGEVVNVASRMQGVAQKGEVVLTQSTFEEIKDIVACDGGGKVQVKGIKDPIMAYYARGIKADLGRAAQQAPGKEGRDASLQKLEESTFVPRFDAPAGLRDKGALVSQLKSVFSDLSKLLEDAAEDYHEAYAFKKFLQDRWNNLVKGLES